MKIVLMMLLALVFLAGCGEKPQPGATVADVAAGKTLAQKTCIGCHDANGKGVTEDIPHLAAQVEVYLHAALIAYKEGKRGHAALRDLTAKMTEQDIINVSAYYAGLPPVTGQIAEVPDITAKGKLAAKTCAACHGENGNSTTAGTPSLAGQQPGYFENAVKAYMDGKREFSSKEKQAMLTALNQVDIEAMVYYFASQTPAIRQAPSFGKAKAGEPLTANCGACHGANGVSSDNKVPNLAAQEPQYLLKSIKAYRERARQQEEMHKFLSKASDADLENITAYYSTQTGKASETADISVQQIVDKCERCHGPGMENPMMIFPKLNGQNKGYLVKALKDYRDNKRGSSPMHKMSLPYSEALMDSVAAWYASQPAR